MTRRPDVLPEKRKPLTKWEFAKLFLEQEGKCAVCGTKLERGKTRDEHVHSLFGGGADDLSNRQLWCLACTKPKDVADAKRHAKIKRLRGETKTGPKKSIPSPGFQTNRKGPWKQKMDGKTVRRDG